jgi:hypothetical protein
MQIKMKLPLVIAAATRARKPTRELKQAPEVPRKAYSGFLGCGLLQEWGGLRLARLDPL